LGEAAAGSVCGSVRQSWIMISVHMISHMQQCAAPRCAMLCYAMLGALCDQLCVPAGLPEVASITFWNMSMH
jgi:hypothetical protein